MANDQDSSDAFEPALQPLYGNPGFMLRRAHQVGVAIFEEETAKYGVTPAQFSVLMVLRACRSLDQISLARRAGFDRSTTTVIVRRLDELRLLVRRPHAKDARRKILSLTRAGRTLLRRVEQLVARAGIRLCSPLDPKECDVLIRLLGKIINGHPGKLSPPMSMRPSRTPTPPRRR